MKISRWGRKGQSDLLTDRWSPVPTHIVSNEEYPRRRPTLEQQTVAHRLREMSRRHAKALGVTRREFLDSACGVARRSWR